MEEKLRQLLDRIPERPPRSKLEPHAEVIRELRKKRRTYSEIASFFREHLQLSVAPSTLHDFVKTRARQARNQAAVAPAFTAEMPKECAPVPYPPLTSQDIRIAKQQPAVTEKKRPLFEFNPEEPLTLTPKPEKK